MAKKNVKKIKASGVVTVYINSSFNNTILTARDNMRSVIAWASSGSSGFKHTKEATPFAAQSAAEQLSNKMKPMQVEEIDIAFNGMGAGRDAVLKTLSSYFKVRNLSDITPVAHNGTRAPKKRRS